MSGRYGRYVAVIGGLIVALILIGATSLPRVEEVPRPESGTIGLKEGGTDRLRSIDIRISPEPSAGDDPKGIELGSWPDWVIVVFTATLAWLSWRQHVLERRLAAESGDALNIAKQSADAARDLALTANKRERAYLFPWIRFVRWTGNDIIITVEFRNFGRTPAIIKGGLVEQRLEAPTDPTPSYRSDEVTADSVTIPNESISWPINRPVPQNFFIAGFVRYDDIFGQSHFSRFMLYCRGLQPRLGEDGQIVDYTLMLDPCGQPEWNAWD